MLHYQSPWCALLARSRLQQGLSGFSRVIRNLEPRFAQTLEYSLHHLRREPDGFQHGRCLTEIRYQLQHFAESLAGSLLFAKLAICCGQNLVGCEESREVDLKRIIQRAAVVLLAVSVPG